MAITAAVTGTFDLLRNYAGSFTWAPVVDFSRTRVKALLQRIKVGQLVIIDRDGGFTVCGAAKPKNGSPRTQLRVLNEAFWVRLLLFADMVGCSCALFREKADES